MEPKSLISVFFQSWFLSSYFAIPLDQNSSLTPFWKVNLNTQMLTQKRLNIFKKSGDRDLVSTNFPNVSKYPQTCET